MRNKSNPHKRGSKDLRAIGIIWASESNFRLWSWRKTSFQWVNNRFNRTSWAIKIRKQLPWRGSFPIFLWKLAFRMHYLSGGHHGEIPVLSCFAGKCRQRYAFTRLLPLYTAIEAPCQPLTIMHTDPFTLHVSRS